MSYFPPLKTNFCFNQFFIGRVICKKLQNHFLTTEKLEASHFKMRLKREQTGNIIKIKLYKCVIKYIYIYINIYTINTYTFYICINISSRQFFIVIRTIVYLFAVSRRNHLPAPNATNHPYRANLAKSLQREGWNRATKRRATRRETSRLPKPRLSLRRRVN